MRKTGLILATMLVALCVLGAMSPASGNLLQAPEISLEMNGVPVTTLNVAVCSKFTLEFWIRDIPDGWGVVAFDIVITWNHNLIELLEADPVEREGWTSAVSQGPGFAKVKFFTVVENRWIGNATWVLFTFHCLGEGTDLMVLESPGDSILLSNGVDIDPTLPEPCEVTVHQFKAVGGVVVPVDKLAVLSPYLALIGLVGVVTVAVAATRRRKP